MIDWLPWYGWLFVFGVPAAALAVMFWPVVVSVFVALPVSVRLAIGAVAGAVVAYLKGRSDARDAAKAEQEKRDAAAVAKRQEIDSDVRRMAPGEAQKELEDKWSRD